MSLAISMLLDFLRLQDRLELFRHAQMTVVVSSIHSVGWLPLWSVHITSIDGEVLDHQAFGLDVVHVIEVAQTECRRLSWGWRLRDLPR